MDGKGGEGRGGGEEERKGMDAKGEERKKERKKERETDVKGGERRRWEGRRKGWMGRESRGERDGYQGRRERGGEEKGNQWQLGNGGRVWGARPAPAEEPRGPGWSEMLQGERRRGAPAPGSTEPAG